jgi:hypothetical protein
MRAVRVVHGRRLMMLPEELPMQHLTAPAPFLFTGSNPIVTMPAAGKIKLPIEGNFRVVTTYTEDAQLEFNGQRIPVGVRRFYLPAFSDLCMYCPFFIVQGEVPREVLVESYDAIIPDEEPLGMGSNFLSFGYLWQPFGEWLLVWGGGMCAAVPPTGSVWSPYSVLVENDVADDQEELRVRRRKLDWLTAAGWLLPHEEAVRAIEAHNARRFISKS